MPALVPCMIMQSRRRDATCLPLDSEYNYKCQVPDTRNHEKKIKIPTFIALPTQPRDRRAMKCELFIICHGSFRIPRDEQGAVSDKFAILIL
jgi:hypothetical protein